MKIKSVILFASFLISMTASLNAFAQNQTPEGAPQTAPETPIETQPPPSMVKVEQPKHWTDGVHIIAGLGINASSVETSAQARSLGIGSNLRSDVGYYFGNGLGLEFSGSVMFNKIKGALLWNTTLATGLRFGLPFLKRAENFAPYGRVLVGKATNVVIFDGEAPAPYSQTGASRVQLEGLMLGAGIGFFQRSSSGRIWYMELTAERHAMDRLEAIRDVNDVPMVVSKESLKERNELYALCLTIGLMVF